MIHLDPIHVLWYGVGGVLVGSLLVWAAIWVERRVRWMLRSLWNADGVDRQAVHRTWKEIERMASSANVYELRQAVVKADSLLDDVLKKKQMPGPDMARRLKFALHRFPELRMIWRSHHLRNQIVHEHDRVFKRSQLRSALKDYKTVLRILGAL